VGNAWDTRTLLHSSLSGVGQATGEHIHTSQPIDVITTMPTARGGTTPELQLGKAINSLGDALLSKVTAEVGPARLGAGRAWHTGGALLPLTRPAPRLQGAAAAGTGAFLSPYGLAEALGLLLFAAEPGSASAQQLEQVVFGGASCDGDGALGAALSALRGALTAGSDGSDGLTVSVGSSSWLASGLALQPEYGGALKAAFGAEARTITDAAAVNSWVAAATRDKIDSIVDDGTVAQATLLLVNALYYKGLWANQFQK